jgi:hypothetical protein
MSGLLPGQNSPAKRKIQATYIDSKPKIDGKIDEEFWLQSTAVHDFIENSPEPNTASSQQTYVRIVYNTEAIYIAAYLYDTAPDSILKQLSIRDDIQTVNADYFTVFIDGMYTQQNSFSFTVTAAGVQGDASDGDPVWDAAWKSAVQREEDGWTLEMEIPYSQLRFPKSDSQIWGINFKRSIRRHREISYWSPIDPEINGEVQQYGMLTGISQIKPPIRLSFTPYAAAYLRVAENPLTNQIEWKPNGTIGTDMKLGINESFTLDLSLIPDFGDVQYDNLEFNISPFEIYYAERRPFFTEGTAIFNRASLFYSRRVGATPQGFGSVYSQLSADEVVLTNPEKTQLINALKLSGRTKSGLGIGVFNGITAPSYAEVQNETTGEKRVIETENFVNHNVVVVDQQWRNNSFLSFTNTSTIRFGNYTDANVSGVEFRYTFNKNKYVVSGDGSYSYRFLDQQKFQNGFKSYLNIGKISGKLRYNVSQSVVSPEYNINDLGFFTRTNYMTTSANVNYVIFKPFWWYNSLRLNLGTYMDRLYQPNQFMRWELYGSAFGTFKNFLTAGIDFAFQPLGYTDYYEARIPNQPWKKPVWGRIGAFFSSDYRKVFALDGDISYRPFQAVNEFWKDADVLEMELSPRFRINDKLNLVLLQNTVIRRNNIGYVTRLNGSNVIFGSRYYQTMENRITFNVLFNHLISLSLNLRHYWALVRYDRFFNLQENGDLELSPYAGKHDQNYNAFNLDLIFRWRFAPGSEMNIVWKNIVLNSNSNMEYNYFTNFSQMFEENQLNQFSVKVLYFLDVYRLLPQHKRGKRM